MSQGTPINKLGNNNMNDEDSRLVDSILNDLNSKPSQPPPQPPQEGMPPQPISPEQHKAMLAQRQQAMMQQQMMMQQQAMMQQQQTKEKKDTSESILDKLQDNWKVIAVVFVLSFMSNSSPVDNIFKLDTSGFFMNENGELNMQTVLIKALCVAIVYSLFVTFVPLN